MVGHFLCNALADLRLGLLRRVRAGVALVVLDGLVDHEAHVLVVVERGRVDNHELRAAVLREVDGLAGLFCQRLDAIVVAADVGGRADDRCCHAGLLTRGCSNKHIII